MHGKKLGVGVIGSGFAARTLIFAARRLKRCRVAGIYGGSAAPRLAAEHGLTLHPTLEELLDSEVDLIVVASPHDSHAGYCEASLLRGKHVFCEKPFVSDPDRGRELIALAEERRLVLSVNHFQRFRRPNVLAKEALAQGLIGRVTGFHDQLLEQRGNAPWQRRPANLGFLFGYGVHAIDKLTWWLGAPVRCVEARCVFDRDEVERATTAWLELANGIRGTLLCSDQKAQVSGGMPGKAEFRAVVFGQRGLLEVDSYGDVTLHAEGGQRHLGALARWRSFSSPRRLLAYTRAVEQAVRAIDGQAPLELRAEDALHNVEVALAAYRASREGKAVCV